MNFTSENSSILSSAEMAERINAGFSDVLRRAHAKIKNFQNFAFFTYIFGNILFY